MHFQLAEKIEDREVKVGMVSMVVRLSIRITYNFANATITMMRFETFVASRQEL